MFLGIDLGTSSVKAVLIDDNGERVDESVHALSVSTPQPTWSEQDPGAWWRAALAAVACLRAGLLPAVRAVGLSGQMHGAVLLDGQDHVIRPAILWNDGRAAAACNTLEQREPRSRAITRNQAMPGFTAPKLIWIAANEPANFRRIAHVLLPKDWLRLKLTGEFVSEPSDAAGTLWLDVAQRRWSTAMLAACELDARQMPRLVEGTEVSGQLTREAAKALGLRPGLPVAGGGSDNACGAVGFGIVGDGDAMLSLGTSGVIFVADAVVRSDPERGVHAFCHCVPRMWHRMAVTLSGAGTLSVVSRLVGAASEGALVAEVEAAGMMARAGSRLVMLPYFSGERTPHNDPTATGVFFGIDGATSRVDLGRAALEGVAFALADGLDALEASGLAIGSLDVIGGGSRSRLWGRIIATALDRPLVYRHGGDLGPAMGAARLARIAAGGTSLDEGCQRPAVSQVIEPEPVLAAALAPRRALFRRLYADLKPAFAGTIG
ncbi:MAG: xylulokinase [Betaproteobacteria bacterium]